MKKEIHLENINSLESLFVLYNPKTVPEIINIFLDGARNYEANRREEGCFTWDGIKQQFLHAIGYLLYRDSFNASFMLSEAVRERLDKLVYNTKSSEYFASPNYSYLYKIEIKRLCEGIK